MIVRAVEPAFERANVARDGEQRLGIDYRCFEALGNIGIRSREHTVRAPRVVSHYGRNCNPRHDCNI
jgi:hypothetical protein